MECWIDGLVRNMTGSPIYPTLQSSDNPFRFGVPDRSLTGSLTLRTRLLYALSYGDKRLVRASSLPSVAQSEGW